MLPFWHWNFYYMFSARQIFCQIMNETCLVNCLRILERKRIMTEEQVRKDLEDSAVQGPNGGSYGSSLYAACGLVRRSAGHAALQNLSAELVRCELD